MAQAIGEKFPGNLDLRNLQILPENVQLSAGGGIYLRNLQTLPENAKLSAGGNLFLQSLQTLPENAKLSAGGCLDLQSLKTLPENAQLSAGGYIDLQSLQTLPENAQLSAGGYIDLQSLQTLPENAKLSAGEGIYLGSLQGPRPSFPRPTFPMIVEDGRKIIADGICQELVGRKGTVYRVRSFGQSKVTYLVQSGDKFAHGDTLKQARESLVYKIGSRDTSKFKGMSVDDTLSFEGAVEAYRAITGACETGTRGFVERQGRKKSYKISEIIEITEGQFGHREFKAFFGGRE
jgi:hypothetical protein